MTDKNNPEMIPALVSRALHWLDQLKVDYRYCREAEMWEVDYKNLYILIPNYCDDREIGYVAPVYIDDDDSEIQKMVFDFAVQLVNKEPEFENADLFYNGNGIGHVAKWYGIVNDRYKPRLFKKKFIEMLDDIHSLQVKFQFMTDVAYEALFNPPVEVLQEALRGAGIDKKE